MIQDLKIGKNAKAGFASNISDMRFVSQTRQSDVSLLAVAADLAGSGGLTLSTPDKSSS